MHSKKITLKNRMSVFPSFLHIFEHFQIWSKLSLTKARKYCRLLAYLVRTISWALRLRIFGSSLILASYSRKSLWRSAFDFKFVSCRIRWLSALLGNCRPPPLPPTHPPPSLTFSSPVKSVEVSRSVTLCQCLAVSLSEILLPCPRSWFVS